MVWPVPHEQLILPPFFVALQNLILIRQKLQYLLEHGIGAGCGLGQLSSRLFRECLKALGALSELIQLSEDLSRFALELLLKIFDRLGVAELFLHDRIFLVGKKTVDLCEQAFGRSTAELEVTVEAGLTEVRQYKEVISLQLLGEDAGHDRLTVRNEVLLFRRALSLCRLLQFVHNFQ